METRALMDEQINWKHTAFLILLKDVEIIYFIDVKTTIKLKK